MSKSNAKKKPEKILIMGLDNSGKTSILLTLQKETNLLSFYSLKPTHGINIVTIEDMDTKFSIWEFGGQQQYREGYLKKENFEKYSQEATKIIFVIDVQDKERYDIALHYFESIFKLIDLAHEKIQLSIFLHKFDPNLEVDESYRKVSADLVNKISEIIPTDLSYNISKTTIYTVFQKTLLESV